MKRVGALMTKIIIVQGISNSGKTTAIKEAMNLSGVRVGMGPNDVLLGAHLHIQGAGYSVGFASGGDSPEIVQRNIDFFKPLNLSHMIFACRSRGGGISKLRAYAASVGVTPIIVSAPSPKLVQDILRHIP
jgi:hypothetical protein